VTRKLFLPGAGGSALFWQPVVERLPAEWDCHSLSWPGLGSEPRDSSVTGIDHLVELVLRRISSQADLIAQSMGGLVAIKVALRSPEKIRRLVLAATSGGLPVESLGGADWRPQYRQDFPHAQSWISEVREDLSSSLSAITAPTLLLWGDQDAISPLPVGEKLAGALPNAVVRRIKGGQHDFAATHPEEVAELIQGHLI
jgi:pimeloyl-ACP methyl ester carboxylesterase